MNTPPRHDFDDFVDKAAMQHQVNGAYPTRQSFEWFIRVHRDRLVAAGAMILVAGRWRFHPASFKDVVVEIGLVQAGRPAMDHGSRRFSSSAS